MHSKTLCVNTTRSQAFSFSVGVSEQEKAPKGCF